MKDECEKNGWVKFYRCIMESTLWKNEKYLKVFLWCLAKANHKDRKIIFNGSDLLIKRGSFVTGYKEALHELRPCTHQTYRSAIDYLISTNRINKQATNKFTMITVCNYDIYQSEKNEDNQPNQQTSNKPVTNQQQTSNNKQECKECNKNEKEFFSEKVNSLFLDFLRINKITDTLRITILAEGLEKLAPGNNDLKIDIIKQAIAGGHHDFRALPKSKVSNTTDIGKLIDETYKDQL